MIILIDAYNLLKNVFHDSVINPKDQHDFVEFLVKYVQYRIHNEIILVFDGGQTPYETQESYKNIIVIHSGYKQTADDVIKNRLQKNQSLDLLLISADRELRKYAKNLNTESLSSMEFYAILQHVMNQRAVQQVLITQTIHKTSDGYDQEVDNLMEYGSRMLIHKELDCNQKLIFKDYHKYGNGKKDKKLLKKIMKI